YGGAPDVPVTPGGPRGPRGTGGGPFQAPAGPPTKPPGRPAQKTKRKRRDPLWARLVVIFGALLMVTSGTVIVGSKVLIGRYTENINQENLLGGAVKARKPGTELEGAINILLLGVDERLSNPGDIRSDTIIILHIPASHDQAYLVSVPRDTFVDVPAFKPSGYPGGRSKITDAFHAGYQNGAGRPGGAQLVAKILNGLTGIEFDGAAIIDFRGFRRVIDALGGVNMCVDHEVESQHIRLVDGKPIYIGVDESKRYQGKPLIHKEGCRRMEGWRALDYSRQRYGLPKGDYDRQRHQQQLIKAMAKEAVSKGMITDPGKLDRVIKAAGKAFTLDTGGVPIADFIFTLRGVAANDLVLVKTNGGDFNSAGVQGTSAESLSPESLEMFGAVRDGTLSEWLISHPAYVSKEK
ncbi:MAG TPA: LCP family protein, partial [Micromonosporaceae bacterium]|nr:LCP family protein [Micromonosporaceae bacterium]